MYILRPMHQRFMHSLGSDSVQKSLNKCLEDLRCLRSRRATSSVFLFFVFFSNLQFEMLRKSTVQTIEV